MRKSGFILGSLFFLYFFAQAQTPVVQKISPPKISLPATLAGKVKLADSLRAKSYTAGQIMKIFLPQYSDAFQSELTSNLTAMFNSGFNAKELSEAIKQEYPGITLTVATKIIYAAYDNRRWKYNQWAWHLQDTITGAFQPTTASTQKMLKDAGESFNTILRYYYPLSGVNDTSFNKVTHLGEYLKAGFTANDIFAGNWGQYQMHSQWLNAYCTAMKNGGLNARQTGYPIFQYLGSELCSKGLRAAGYTAEQVLDAIQSFR